MSSYWERLSCLSSNSAEYQAKKQHSLYFTHPNDYIHKRIPCSILLICANKYKVVKYCQISTYFIGTLALWFMANWASNRRVNVCLASNCTTSCPASAAVDHFTPLGVPFAINATTAQRHIRSALARVRDLCLPPRELAICVRQFN